MTITTTVRYAIAANLLAGFLAATSAAAEPQKPADPANGKALARSLCANCHVTDASNGAGDAVKPDVPAFRAIANAPGQSPERIAGRIIIPHPAMPDLQLTMSDVRDLVAYIGSLKDAR